MTIDERITIRIADDHDKHIVCKTLINLKTFDLCEMQWVVAYVDSMPIGVMIFRLTPIYKSISVVTICALYVDIPFRRQRVASTLITRMASITAGGCLYAQMLVGHCSSDLEPLLRLCGFVETRSTKVAKMFRLFYCRPLQLGTRQTMFETTI